VAWASADQAIAQTSLIEVLKSNGFGCDLVKIEQTQENRFAAPDRNMFGAARLCGSSFLRVRMQR